MIQMKIGGSMWSNIHVMGIPEVQGYEKLSLMCRGKKRYEYIEKEFHALSRNIISNLRG